MEIKDKIKRRRIELGLTQLEIAKKVGVSEATVSRWESGNIAEMKRSKIALLAEALKVSPTFIMGWEDEGKFMNLKVNNTENTLVESFRKLTPAQRDIILTTITVQIESNAENNIK